MRVIATPDKLIGIERGTCRFHERASGMNAMHRIAKDVSSHLY